MISGCSYAYTQYMSTVAANSTSIIVSLCLMCRKKCLIWLIIYSEIHVHCILRSLHRNTFKLLFGDNDFFYCLVSCISSNLISNRKNKFFRYLPKKKIFSFLFQFASHRISLNKKLSPFEQWSLFYKIGMLINKLH